MHGTYEANHAMHDCDLMICLGARFDDRVTGKVDAFSPDSKKIHLDIDRLADQQESCASICRIVADAAKALQRDDRASGRPRSTRSDAAALKDWWKQIDHWRAKKSLSFKNSDTHHQAAICHRPAV